MSIAIITGASGGIGSEFARQLHAQAGVNKFWFVSRRKDKMEALRDELGVEAKIICADLATEEGIYTVKSALEEEKPEVKFLVNASGCGRFGAFDVISQKETETVIDLNVKALVILTHMVIPYMQRGGRIIELGSGSCFTPLPYFNIYSSSKVFVLHYTKSLNYEIKKYGLKATCFCPGWVDTDFLGNSMSNGNVHPKEMKPLLSCEKVVRGCVKASMKGKALYVTNWYTKLQHLLFKITPDFILTEIWLGKLTDGEKEKM